MHSCAARTLARSCECSARSAHVRRARLVVGADGVRSAVRRCMFPDEAVGPRYLVGDGRRQQQGREEGWGAVTAASWACSCHEHVLLLM